MLLGFQDENTSDIISFLLLLQANSNKLMVSAFTQTPDLSPCLQRVLINIRSTQNFNNNEQVLLKIKKTFCDQLSQYRYTVYACLNGAWSWFPKGIFKTSV